MANDSVTFTSLDFDTHKADLIEFLKSHNIFKDYDYEGSNINLLVDLLSYNTNKNAFLVNMGISESFLDTARLRSSMVSHAKDLNYIPYSHRSAKGSVSVTFESPGSSQPYVIEKGSLFSAIVKNEAYTFCTPQALTVSSSTTNSESGNYIFTFDTDVYEGYYVKDSYIYKAVANTVTPRFKITNPQVDINSLTVAVYENSNSTPTTFTRSDTLLGLTANSTIFFIQGVGNGFYEVLFGDGTFGRKPLNNARIVLDYRISSGEKANGAKTFSMDFDPTGVGEMTTHTVTTTANAVSGAINQSLDSIRTLAPRHFAAQQRAVGTDDYKSIALAKYNGILSDINVYGGEQLEPKQYGRVVLAMKPITGTYVSDITKQEIVNHLLSKVSIPTRVLTTDPEYLYCQVTSAVQYNLHDTSKTDTEIKQLVRTAIKDYSLDNLEKFDKDFRYSRFVRAIDIADDSIVSNDTSIKIIKKLSPVENTENTFSIKTFNQLHPARGATISATEPVVSSSSFTYIDAENVSWPVSYIRDDGAGALIVYTYINEIETTLNSSLGTVNHTTGELYISKLNGTDFGSFLSLYLTPLNKDVVVMKENIMIIDLDDVTVSVSGVLE